MAAGRRGSSHDQAGSGKGVAQKRASFALAALLLSGAGFRYHVSGCRGSQRTGTRNIAG